jgi:hypothetical protein
VRPIIQPDDGRRWIFPDPQRRRLVHDDRQPDLLLARPARLPEALFRRAFDPVFDLGRRAAAPAGQGGNGLVRRLVEHVPRVINTDGRHCHASGM